MPKWLQIVWGLAAVLVIVGSVSFLVALYVHTNLYPPSIGGVAVSSQAQVHSGGPKNDIAPDRRGTLEHPFIVRTIRTPEEAQRETEDRDEKATNDRRLIFATAALAFVTVGLVAYTGVLSHATRQLVRDAKNTAERELRAYVFIENAWAKSVYIGETKNFPQWGVRDVTYIIKNTGHTPAHKVRVFAKAEVTMFPIIIPVVSEFDYYGTLAPNGDFIECEIPRVEGVDDRGGAFDKREQAIVLSGRIVYHDVFGHERWTEFCYVTTGAPTESQEMEVYPEGNESI